MWLLFGFTSLFLFFFFGPNRFVSFICSTTREKEVKGWEAKFNSWFVLFCCKPTFIGFSSDCAAVIGSFRSVLCPCRPAFRWIWRKGRYESRLRIILLKKRWSCVQFKKAVSFLFSWAESSNVTLSVRLYVTPFTKLSRAISVSSFNCSKSECF